MTSPKIVSTLPLFKGLSPEARDALVQAGRIRRIEIDERLFSYGDPVKNFYVLCSGAIKLYRQTPNGHETTAEVLIAGDTIGENEIMQSLTSYQYSASAVKETTLLEFPSSWLKENSKKHQELSLNLLTLFARRLNMTAIEAEHKSTMSAAQQVICFLEKICVLHDFDPRGFELPYSKTLIASRLGMELETFSRTLSRIREHGILVKGTTVCFQDIDAVETFVCGDCSVSGNCLEHQAIKARLKNGQSISVA